MSQAPCQFDDELVLRQLRYTGMVETVKIRKAGYSVRMSYEVCVCVCKLDTTVEQHSDVMKVGGKSRS